MVKFLILIIFVSTQQIIAQSNTDFSHSDSKENILSVNDIRDRFKLRGEVFVTDGEGKLLYQGGEIREYGFGKTGDLVANWSFQSPGLKIALKHSWTLSNDGKITAKIQQFDSMTRGESGEVKTGKLLREEKIEVKDFAPVNWIAFSDSNKHIAVRFTPKLEDKGDFIQVNALPMTLNNPVVFDNKGRVWAHDMRLEGRYVSMKTHLGLIAMSYSPFPGAKEIGYVKGSEMTINADKDLTISIKSEGPILATSKRAKIYGLVDSNKKSDRLTSVFASSSNEEKQFLQNIQ